jgi:ribosomal protein L31
MLDITVSPFKRMCEKVEEEISIIQLQVGKKIVDQNIQLEMKLMNEKQQSILFEQRHGWSSKENLPPEEYLPLTDPDKKQVHHHICRPCHPIYSGRQKANKGKSAISVQRNC